MIAESYERIHRSNLVGMGILPLQFLPGQNAESLHLTGEEIYAIGDAPGQLKAMLDGKFADGKEITVFAESDLGKTIEFSVDGAHRYAAGDSVLPERRHPAVRSAAAGGQERGLGLITTV